MGAVRPLEERDIPEVTSLYGRVYPQERSSTPAQREAYFREIFFGNPWADPAFPSWVAPEGERIVGFIGVMPRPMRYKGAALQAAVVTQLMVDRDKGHSVAAAQLLRKALAGPQDLTISDGANETSRRMWEALGGATSTLYTLRWTRVLSPARYAVQTAAGRHSRSAALAHAFTARRPRACRSRLTEAPLDAQALLAAHQVNGRRLALSPHYDLHSLDWLLAHAAAKRRHGALQARVLKDAHGVAGWFLYYLDPRTSRVLQVEARPGAEEAVLAHLFQHAKARGAAHIEGRMDPRLARALSSAGCLFIGGEPYALLHSREAALLAALERGEARFSRLEGEWWMRFTGEPSLQVSPARGAAELLSRLRLAWLRTRAQPALP